jgi:hypothetical protein
MVYRDIAVVEFPDGFTIAVNAPRWWKEVSEECIRLRRGGEVRVHTFNRLPNGEIYKLDCVHARV